MGKSKELAELGDVVTQSGGNVGIGTSSPVAKLQIRTQTDANAAFQNSTSVSGGVKINAFTDAANASVPFELDGSSLQFNTAAVERMRIDASGRVTMPYQPAFYAYNTGGSANIGTNTNIIAFTHTFWNVGGHFNTSNGLFTAPVTGVYHFIAHEYRHTSTGYNRLWISCNGTTRVYEIKGSVSGDHNSEISLTIPLQANDWVGMQHQSDQNNSYYRADAHTYFMGYLIG